MMVLAARYCSKRNTLWLAAWLACMAAVSYGLARARHWALAEVGTIEVRAEWQRWRSEEQARAEDTTGSVQRRAPKSDEPPLLILLRDYFPATVVSVLLIATVMFGFLAIVVPGALRSRSRLDDNQRRAEARIEP